MQLNTLTFYIILVLEFYSEAAKEFAVLIRNSEVAILLLWVLPEYLGCVRTIRSIPRMTEKSFLDPAANVACKA